MATGIDYPELEITGPTEDLPVANIGGLADDLFFGATIFVAGPGGALATEATLDSGALLSVSPDGIVHYDASANQATLQGLAEGELAIDRFVVYGLWPDGQIESLHIAVHVAGVNDAPTIYPVGAMSVFEEDAPGTLSGMLFATDVDSGSTLSYHLGATSDPTGQWGTMAVTPGGNYAFTPDMAQLGTLAGGQTVQVSYTVFAQDELGATAPTDLVFHLFGQNDAPTLDPVMPVTVQDTEGTETGVTVVGALAGHDADPSDQIGYQIFSPGDSQWGVFTLALDGSYTYEVNPAALDALGTGQSVVVSNWVAAVDGQGLASNPVEIAITLVGMNEVVLSPVPPDPVERFIVNFGKQASGKNVIEGFDNNDVLDYTGNLSYAGARLEGGDTVVSFDFQRGKNIDAVEVTLVGYTGFTPDQVAAMA